MHDDDAPNFKIRLDDDIDDEADKTADETAVEKEVEDEDEAPQKMRKHSRVAEPNRKIGLTGFLLIGLSIAALAGVYFSLKNQISANTNAGATAVTSLSINLESRLTSIADAQQELDKKIDSNLAGITGRIQKIEKSVTAVRTSKSDKTEVEKALSDIEKKLSPVQKEIEDMKSKISAFNESTRDKIAGFNQSLSAYAARIDKTNTEFSRLNSEISELKTEKLGKSALQESLKSENEKTMTLINNLNREISILKLRTKALEDRPTETPHGPGSAAKPSAPEKKGDIIEQTIR
jgi:predicted  nucleic acid-binding Zn-ribbon protein